MSSATIAEQVSALNASRAGQPVSDAMKPFAREQQRLASMGQPEGVIGVGSTLPDATLLDPHGEPTSLYGVLGGRLAVIVFYRGAWCPYCNIALRTYQSELLPQLTRHDVALIAVSPQAPDGSLSMQEKNELDVPCPLGSRQRARRSRRNRQRTRTRRARGAAAARPRPRRRQRRRHTRDPDADNADRRP